MKWTALLTFSFGCLVGCSTQPQSADSHHQVGESESHKQEHEQEKQASCSCPQADSLHTIMVEEKYPVLICGYVEETLADGGEMITAMSIQDCRTQNLLLDMGADEISQTKLVVDKGSAQITYMSLAIADSAWNLAAFPYTTATIELAEGVLGMSEFAYVFSPPLPTLAQHDSIVRLCSALEAATTDPVSFYPFDESSLYVLQLGATAGIEAAKKQLQDVSDRFILDGAVAETYAELPLDKILAE